MSQYTQSVQQELHSNSHSFTGSYSAAQSGTDIIISPGYHKSIYITDLIISNGDTAGTFQLYDTGTSAEMISEISLGVNSLFVSNFSQAFQFTPNRGVEIWSTTADDFSVTINYYIDDVVGFGYTSGGTTGSDSTLIGENYFASDSNSTEVGNLTVARRFLCGQSSAVSGYTSGGHRGAYSNVIDKFSFSTDGDSTDVGNLTVARSWVAGQSSAVSGYSSGGTTGCYSVVIDKFSFSSDGNSTDVGDLTEARDGGSGQQSN